MVAVFSSPGGTFTMSKPEPRSFEDFWPIYVGEHTNKTNRMLHFVGTTLAIGSVAAGLVSGRRSFFAAAPFLGYGFAWVGHFFVEHNRPATFDHPLWSLRGDFVMWWKTLNGTMDDEVERITSRVVAQPANDQPANETSPPHAGLASEL